MLNRGILALKPATLAILLLTLLGGALLAALALPTDHVVSKVFALAGVTAFYIYPAWVIYRSPFPASLAATAVATLALLLIIAAFAFQVFDRSTPQGGSDTGEEFVGLLTGLALFAPQVIAASIIRRAERFAGIQRTAGGVTAFLWLFYFPIGWAPIHRRVRLAAGVDDDERPRRVGRAA